MCIVCASLHSSNKYIDNANDHTLPTRFRGLQMYRGLHNYFARRLTKFIAVDRIEIKN